MDEFGLNVVCVTITAATPMCEHAETGFPMPEAQSDGGDASGDDVEAVAESPTSSQSSDSPPISSPPAMPPPPAPTVIRPKPDIVPEAEADQFEANFEANFDANFDAAFDSPPHPPPQEDITTKQVVGGRASIPEELDSQQLERLQNLKESNA